MSQPAAIPPSQNPYDGSLTVVAYYYSPIMANSNRQDISLDYSQEHGSYSVNYHQNRHAVGEDHVRLSYVLPRNVQEKAASRPVLTRIIDNIFDFSLNESVSRRRTPEDEVKGFLEKRIEQPLGDEAEDAAAICAVCHEDLSCGEKMNVITRIVRLDCGHRYHYECIQKWLMLRKNSCPLCRSTALACS